MPGRDIFISYSREDRSAARHFAKCFAEEGFSVWWDATLQAGQTFDEVIERELKSAKAVVVLWSPRSVRSRWVRAEATLADRSNKLVPAIIEACDRPIIFELTHTADLADWTGDRSDTRWRTYVDDIHDLVGRDKAVEAEPEAAAPKAAKQPAFRSFGGRPDSPTRDEESASPAKSRSAPRDVTPVVSEDEDDRTQFYRGPDLGSELQDEFHCLEMADGQKRYVVSPIGVKIGRTAPADIIIPDPGVSRLHCKVDLAGDKLLVSDLNSTNGTFIDDKRIEKEGLLDVGQTLRVGNVTLRHEVRTRANLAA